MVFVTDPDAGELFPRIYGVIYLSVIARIQQTVYGDPNDILDFVVGTGLCGRVHSVYKTPNYDTCRVTPVPTLLIVQSPKISRRGQIDADLFQGFTLGRAAGISVEPLNHSSGQCHLTRPGIIFVLRTFNE